MRPRRRSMTPSAYRSASATAPVGAGVIGLGGRPAILAIEPLIEIVREVDHAVADGERAAAILVSARANAESVGVLGRHAFRLPVRARRGRRKFVPASAAEFRSNRLRRRRARPARDGSSCRRRGRRLWETSKSHRGWRPCFSSRPGVLPMNCTRAAAPQANCLTTSPTTSTGMTRVIAARTCPYLP